MRSLRSRLILGTTLIALIPMAIAMFILSHRIESMVRIQADERFHAALGGLEAQLETDGGRIEEQLAILGRDPSLKRLYLLQPAGSHDLTELLAGRRMLLGLDFLQLADPRGTVVAEASNQSYSVDLEKPDSVTASDHPMRPRIVMTRIEGVPVLAMVAIAQIPYENETAGSVYGGEFIGGAFLDRLKQSTGLDLILRDVSGRPLLATLPGADPGVSKRAAVERVEISGMHYLARSFPLQPRASWAHGFRAADSAAGAQAGITGLIPTAPTDRTVFALQLTSVLLGVLGLGLAILLGTLWSSSVSRPVERLAAFSHRLAQGEWDEPLTLRSVRELETLVAALDRMRTDLRTYRARLVVSERQAAWSQMARKVAHEVKNPLTPIAISLSDLKRSFDQKRADFPEILDQAVRTIGEEVETLKHLLQEFSEFARLPAPRLAPCSITGLFADLESLYGRDVAGGRLAFARPDREVPLCADAGQLRQALVNLIKNGLEVIGAKGRIVVSATVDEEATEIAVSDNGPGLTAEQWVNLFVPGFTSKAQGSGLGLTIVERIVNDHGGTIAVDSGSGTGTTFRIRLPRERRI